MSPKRFPRSACLVLLLACAPPAFAEVTDADYRRAERMLPKPAGTSVDGAGISPHWAGQGGDFWYETTQSGRKRFVRVSGATGAQREVPEQDPASDKPATPGLLPGETASPDGRWAVSRSGFDLQVRDLHGGQAKALTRDGTDGNAYGSLAGLRVAPAAEDAPPVAYFSPDSRRVLTYRLDYAKVPELHLVQTRGGERPGLKSFRYALPGDPVPQAQWLILDLDGGARVDVRHPPTPIRPNSDLQVQWSGDGRSVFFIEEEAGYKRAWIRAIDTATGQVRTLLEEASDTALDRQPILAAFGDGSEVLWSSERSGWRHLYLVDAAKGGIKRQLTRGEWAVGEDGVVHVDPKGRWVYFLGTGREAGRDPYYRHLYRVRLDGSGLALLTPEDGHHQVKFSPDGSVFVDTWSRVDAPPVSVLRTAAGEQVAELQRAKVDRLLATGWRFPERFSVKARDGKTDLYGAMFLPSHFDPAKRYPVIDSIYPGPQSTRVPKAFVLDEAQALAELGFAVVTIDGMGTPRRSKAFREVSYGKLGEAGGLEDHVAGLRQLGERHPYLDLSRVGIYGHSGGGYAAARAILAYPDFYKVAVASAGNHDQRIYHAGWGERYQGYPQGDNYAGQDNASLAGNLKGRLLLAHGGMDDNVHPSQTFALAQALIEANKDFDLMILPDQRHGFQGGANDYFTRRRWDYFVRHLLGQEPPAGYRIGAYAE